MSRDRSAVEPRLLDRDAACQYLGDISDDTLDRLVDAGQLSIVRLPAARDRKTGAGVTGTNRRVFFDRLELDALIDRSREKRS